FGLQVEAAGFNLIVSGDGYDSASVPIVELPRDESPVVALSANGMVTEHFAGALCADANYYHQGFSDYVRPCVTAPVAGHHIIELHRGGTIGLVLRWTYQEDYSDEYIYLNVSCGPYQAERRYSFFAGPATLTFAVPSAGSCDISPNRYASFKGVIAQTTYKIEVVHPR